VDRGINDREVHHFVVKMIQKARRNYAEGTIEERVNVGLEDRPRHAAARRVVHAIDRLVNIEDQSTRIVNSTTRE